MIKTAVVGLGFMGQTHLGCYRNNPLAQVVAVGDSNAERLQSGAKVSGNIDANSALDLSGLRTETDIEALINDTEIDLIDFCLPTRQHAEFTIRGAATRASTFCAKSRSRGRSKNATKYLQRKNRAASTC